MRRLDDPVAVAEQYRDSRRLDARRRIYELYGQNPTSWMERVFDALELAPHERVLEVGAGTGNLWLENARRLPPGVEPVLSDRSAGILAQARDRLPPGFARRLALADVCALPFAAGSFDLAIANHMLYHVEDRARALAELHRVLSTRGRCVVGTNDWTHLIELRELCERFGIQTMFRPVGREPGFFDAEQAGAELSVCFARVEVFRHHDCLDVTDSAVLVDYVRSLGGPSVQDAARLDRLRAHVAEQIARLGALHLTTALALFVARK